MLYPMTTTLLPSKSPFGRIVIDGELHNSWCELWAVWSLDERGVGTSHRCTCDKLTAEDMVAWWALQARAGVIQCGPLTCSVTA